MSTSIEITEDITQVNVTEDVTTINITPAITSVEVKGVSIATTSATGMGTAHANGSRFTSVTVQGSLDQASTGLDSVSANASAAIAANLSNDNTMSATAAARADSVSSTAATRADSVSSTAATRADSVSSTALASYVELTGDTMTGELTVPRLRVERDNGTAVITLHDNTDDDDHVIYLTGMIDTDDDGTPDTSANIFSLGTNDITNQFQLHSWQDRDFEFTFGSDKHVDAVATISTSGLDVVGQITASEKVESPLFKGDLEGAVHFKATDSGTTLAKGDVVYITGHSGQRTTVDKADASDSAKMPAFGIVNSVTGSNVDVLTFGNLVSLSTTGIATGTELFVSATTPGGYETSPPAGEGNLIQKIAKVVRGDSASGSIKIMGAGRTNATPNLDEGNIFIGNASNQPVTSSLSSEFTSRFNTAITSTTTSIQTASSNAATRADSVSTQAATRISTVSAVAAANTSALDTVSAAVVANESRLNSMSTTVVSNTSRVDSMSTTVVSNTSRVNTLSSTVAAMDTATVSSNAATARSALSGRIDTVSSAAATNASDINTVSSAVVTVDGRVDTVSSAVVTVDGRVDTVSSAAATNATDINTVSSAVVTVNGRVDTVSSAAATNASDINTVSSAVVTVDGRVDTVSSAAATNASDINTVSSAVVTVDGRVDTVSSAVASITEYTDTAVQTYLDGGTASATLSAVRLNSVHIHSTALTGTEFKNLHGSRIVKNGGSNITYGSFQPVAADVGKTWTIINPSSANITLDWDGQYVHVMNGSETNARKTDWQLQPGSVVDIICIDSAANGGSGQTEPNFVIYGTGIVDI